ncbi:hypothetical protein I4U23_012342 [Adineta vaga]|nr:hypothetical protein I4U23_012342 [Adineta vaga]
MATVTKKLKIMAETECDQWPCINNYTRCDGATDELKYCRMELADNRSICVCPPNRWGARCLLRNNACHAYENMPCLNGGQCIRDDGHLVRHDKFSMANCFQLNSTMKHSCFGQNSCENGAECLQDKLQCPSCYYGIRCQFSTNLFSLSLDAILGYHIQSQVSVYSAQLSGFTAYQTIRDTCDHTNQSCQSLMELDSLPMSKEDEGSCNAFEEYAFICLTNKTLIQSCAGKVLEKILYKDGYSSYYNFIKEIINAFKDIIAKLT